MDADHSQDTWEPWVAMIISNAIMSIVSCVGIVAIAGRKGKYFDHCMSFLLSLGVGCLLTDAVLHLIPHAFGLHGHDHGHGEHHGDHHEEHHNTTHHNTTHHNEHEEHHEENVWASDNYIWKGVVCLAGTFAFLLIQLILTVVFGQGHSHDGQKNNELVAAKNNSGFEQNEDGAISKRNGVAVGDGIGPRPNVKFSFKTIQTGAWLILIGDGVHNVMDGIATGGAFSEPFPAGLQGGVMTSIAILIHELPHEFADFALLIQTGLSFKQALILNLLSSLTSFIGGIAGVALGTKMNAGPWIMAATAGNFMYLSLSIMLPEILNHPLLTKSKQSKLVMGLNILGFVLGFLVLFFLALYEHALINALK